MGKSKKFLIKEGCRKFYDRVLIKKRYRKIYTENLIRETL